MKNNSNSTQHHTNYSINSDPLRDPPPLFQTIEPKTIRTISKASELFISLVDFIKEGNHLDENATWQACTLLRNITPKAHNSITPDKLLHDLVWSWWPPYYTLAESIVVLLTSSNEELANASLRILYIIAIKCNACSCFDFIDSGFFTFLPRAFYEQEMHLVAQPALYLMTIVNCFLFCASSTDSREICEHRRISMDAFERTFLDKFFHPVRPFLEFTCQNRRRCNDYLYCPNLSKLIGTIIEFSPFIEEMTQFVLSSSVAFAFTDTLVFLKTRSLIQTLFAKILDGHTQWQKSNPTVQKRGQQIVEKLCVEGLSDELDQLCHFRYTTDLGRLFISSGACLIDHLGGNIPFFVEKWD
ncbi:hypothetical protein BLNAU_6803 [Blattamonas nauphoetae]|uniref:Uncharacterized protein n=1 Tax=Blattamonas nauphoetae TaxID=2049346 RepID=A0ABQ9Y3J5_9EUKA|nr:hypothetical protein BLNAU_6803 [Blattamonas nauphoetae]